MDKKASCITINCGCCGGSNREESVSDNIYSTEETICGTWIDGKPIYRIVISGIMQIESGRDFAFADVSALGIGRLINLYGNMIENDNYGHLTIQTSYNGPDGIYAAVNMYYASTIEKINCYLLNNRGRYSGSTAYVVLEYTKK